MSDTVKPSSAIVFEYTDALEGFKGWFVRDRMDYRLCAGGVRIQPGLNLSHLQDMAGNMTRKMQIAGIRVDGAKCGIDYSPGAPGRHEALRRFLKALRPYIMDCYSMGPDLNLDFQLLEKTAQSVNIPSTKIAIAKAQKMTNEEFWQRYDLLSHSTFNHTLNWLRAGSGLATAVSTAILQTGMTLADTRLAVQGYGSLAKGALFQLWQAGARIVAIADVHRCFLSESPHGLDLSHFLSNNSSILLDPPASEKITVLKSEDVLAVDCDVLIPAAIESALTEEQVSGIRAGLVVPGANLAITPAIEKMLIARGVQVVPDFLAGCGGSISMDVLFGSREILTMEDILSLSMERMSGLVANVFKLSRRDSVSLTEAALALCRNFRAPSEALPYGPLQE